MNENTHDTSQAQHEAPPSKEWLRAHGWPGNPDEYKHTTREQLEEIDRQEERHRLEEERDYLRVDLEEIVDARQKEDSRGSYTDTEPSLTPEEKMDLLHQALWLAYPLATDYHIDVIKSNINEKDEGHMVVVVQERLPNPDNPFSDTLAGKGRAIIGHYPTGDQAEDVQMQLTDLKAESLTVLGYQNEGNADAQSLNLANAAMLSTAYSIAVDNNELEPGARMFEYSPPLDERTPVSQVLVQTNTDVDDSVSYPPSISPTLDL